MTKAELRIECIQRRAAIDSEHRALFNQLIFERAHKTRAFQLARTIHVYRNRPDEVATDAFMEYAWATGKRVVVPCVTSSHPSGLVHVQVNSSTQWRQGALGIREPATWVEADVVDPLSFDATACILVPVVGFDRTCHRLGYGKGMYDAFLTLTQGAVAIGLAYEQQRVDPRLPVDSHDVPLAAVVTNERTYLP